MTYTPANNMVTCKIVVLLQACAFGSYFLGNGVTNASKDASVCVVLKVLASRKRHTNALGRKG